MREDERMMRDAMTRYHSDPTFHALVHIVTAKLVDTGELGRATTGLIAMVLHTRDVIAEQVANPLREAEITTAQLMIKPIAPEVIDRLHAELAALERKQG